MTPRPRVTTPPASRSCSHGQTTTSSYCSVPSPNLTPGGVDSTCFTLRSPLQFSSMRQTGIRASLDPGRKTRVDEAVARFFYSCDIPFYAARSPYFSDMVKEIATYGPSYTHPSYETLRTRLLDSEKEAVERALSVFREQWPFHGVSIIADGWSDTRSRSVHGILAYSRGKSCFLKSIDNSEGGKTAERLADIWTEAIMQVGPEHVVQLVADGEFSNRATRCIIESRFPSISFTPCMAHCMNNLLKDIAKLDWMEPTIERARGIVSFITRHHYILAIYRRFSSKDLLKYSETRFAYNFIMLQRLLEVSQSLRQLVVSDEWLSWRDASGTTCMQCRADVLDDDFWESVSYIDAVVTPIIKLMRLVDGDEPCIGKVYEGLDRMIENIKNVVLDADEAQELETLAIERWNSYHVAIHAAAYVLDPEFQGNKQERDKEVQRGWEATLHRMVPDPNARREIKDQLAFYRTRQGLFGFEDAQRDRCKISSALWWEEYGADTPQLRDLSIKILSQGASSSPCERLWSSFSSIATKKRNRLGVQKASDLMFVNANLRLLHKVTGEYSREAYIGLSHPDSGSDSEEHDA